MAHYNSRRAAASETNGMGHPVMDHLGYGILPAEVHA